MWRSRLASRVSVSLLPSSPSRRAERKHRSLPRFAASRRWSCCLPRRRRRWTRLCGRSSQRHPPHPPRPSHLPPLPLQLLLPPTPLAAAACAAAASQWSSRARPGRAGCGPAEPGRMWSGWAGLGRILFCNVAAAASPRQPAPPPTAFGCGRGGAEPARGRRSAKQNKVCVWFDDCVQ